MIPTSCFYVNFVYTNQIDEMVLSPDQEHHTIYLEKIQTNSTISNKTFSRISKDHLNTTKFLIDH
jgi:hypothetical protein